MLCLKAELAAPCEMLLRASWEYWLLFWTSYKVDGDKLVQSLFPWGRFGTSLLQELIKII